MTLRKTKSVVAPLAQAGTPYSVGVTGHRPNRMPKEGRSVEARLRDALAVVRHAAINLPSPPSDLVALSSIAEGADRLFAEVALKLGFKLHAVLPFVSVDYETTFDDASTTRTYRSLLRRSGEVTVLAGSLDNATEAYESVGREIVDKSDVLVAVWDGKPSAGRGGTPEIVDYALRRNKPIIWIDPASERVPTLLGATGQPDAQEITLSSGAATRVVPLTELAFVSVASAVH